MIPLHSVVPPPVTGFFRLNLQSMTAYIARGHIYEIARGTPPPMEEQDSYARRYWRPFHLLANRHPRTAWPTPLCGKRLVTRSTRISGSEAFIEHTFCDACTNQLAPTAVMANRRRDPWALIPHEDRFNTPDPVSGA